ncbi:hypothetical protein I314_00760 [Cryptococcus bacillisporus CA1873]|uniref:Uncharacterized protein n=1 Tax=Cryptococcus bacillisporus CA1873 TaxID=1296111 RepID=A0ABR5BGS0_CRYGA|nr:hypothetical protein I314_00760 [Cryptococcus bacillisporus CA1873]|eukprot:KIR68342.1 hypothetical protein I314_00760 [Cryptococcus gattii CA1873]
MAWILMLPAMNTYEHSGILIPFGVAKAIQGDQMGRSSGCT